MSTNPDQPDTGSNQPEANPSVPDPGASPPAGDTPPPAWDQAPPPPPSAFEQAPPPSGAADQAPPPPPSAYGQAPPAPGAYGQEYGQAVAAPLSMSEEKGWSLAAHLGVLVAGFLAPLIIWLVFKDRGPFLEHHAKESLNFQITVMIAAFVSAITAVLLIGFVLLLVLLPWMIIMPIIAAVKANNGEWYRYPLTLRLVK